MSPLQVVKTSCHGACCGAYSLIVAGVHDPAVYLVAALAYGGLTIADMVGRHKDPPDKASSY